MKSGAAAVVSVGLFLFFGVGTALADTTFYTGSDDAITDTSTSPTQYGFTIDQPGNFNIGDNINSLTATRIFVQPGTTITPTLFFFDGTVSQRCDGTPITPTFAPYSPDRGQSITFNFSGCVIEANTTISGLLDAGSRVIYFDYHNNTYPAGSSGDPVGLAGTITGSPGVPPRINHISIVSNNGSTTMSKIGDTVSLSFTSDAAVRTPTVTIAGRAASVATTTGNSFVASTTMQSTDREGAVPFTINLTSVTGINAAAVSTTSDNSAVTFDKTAPVLTITSGVLGGYASSSPITISFSNSETAASTECSFDALATSTCTTTASSTLADGAHTFFATSTDAAGNLGTTSLNFTVDATPPTLTIDSGPTNGATIATSSVAFAFSTSSDAVSLSCSYDMTATSTCSSPFATTSADGAHTFAISAADAAGNVAYIVRSFTVSTAPTPSPAPAPTTSQGGNNGPPVQNSPAQTAVIPSGSTPPPATPSPAPTAAATPAPASTATTESASSVPAPTSSSPNTEVGVMVLGSSTVRTSTLSPATPTLPTETPTSTVQKRSNLAAAAETAGTTIPTWVWDALGGLILIGAGVWLWLGKKRQS